MSACVNCGSQCDADICEQCHLQYEYDQQQLEEQSGIVQQDFSKEPF